MPQTANILDTTMNGEKDAQVIFNYQGHTLTPFGASLMAIAYPATHSVVEDEERVDRSRRQVAVFHRMDATGWSLVSVGPY
jgi:hypothetical protein